MILVKYGFLVIFIFLGGCFAQPPPVTAPAAPLPPSAALTPPVVDAAFSPDRASATDPAPTPAPAVVATGEEEFAVHVVLLEHTPAEPLASTLANLTSAHRDQDHALFSSSIRIIADRHTNALLIVAGEADYLRLLEVIRQLDVPQRGIDRLSRTET